MLLWDSRWPTLELKLFTSVREILGVILNMRKGFPVGSHVPSRAIMTFHTWATTGYLDLFWALSNGEFAWGKVLVICRSFSFAYPFLCYHQNVWWDNYLLWVLSSTFTQTVPPQLQPKISTVCLSTPKRVKIHQNFPLKKCSIQGGHGVIFKKKWWKEVPMILSKNSSKRSSIKWPKNISKSVSSLLPLLWTFVIP